MSYECQTSSDILKKIATLIYQHSGINFPESHLKVLDQRIQQRLKETSIDEEALYTNLLLNKKILFEFIGFVTTNHTHFFRSIEQFKVLESTIIPELVKKNSHVKHITIWSCACSTGEEPYTLALCLQYYFDKYELNDWNYSIIATDIDQSSLDSAINGVYPYKAMKYIPIEYHSYLDIQTNSLLLDDEKTQYFTVKTELKKKIRFSIHNLLEEPIFRNIDIIFCRNVLIYFDEETQEKVINQLIKSLSIDRYFFISPSESVIGLKVQLKPVILPQTIYYTNNLK